MVLHNNVIIGHRATTIWVNRRHFISHEIFTFFYHLFLESFFPISKFYFHLSLQLFNYILLLTYLSGNTNLMSNNFRKRIKMPEMISIGDKRC